MSGPKHLWSGDWREESASAAAERARRRPETPPADDVDTAHQPEPEPAPARPAPARPAAPAPRAAVRSPARAAESPPRQHSVDRSIKGAPLAPPRVAPERPVAPPRPARERSGPVRLRDRPFTLAVALLVLVFVGGVFALANSGGSTGAQASSTSAQPGWLGLQLAYWPTGGAVIEWVSPGSPGETAGLQPGDVITSVDGQPVSSPSDVSRTVAAMQVGSTLSLQIQRGVVTYTTQATLTAQPPGSPVP